MLTSSDPTPHGVRAWKNCEPWLVYTATNQLEEYLTKDKSVFEWGCGGSTIWYSCRAKQVVSIEHNNSWFEKVSERVHQLMLPNVRMYLRGGNEYAEYVAAPQEFDEMFDLVVVDGRQRVRCIKTGMPLVKPGGWLVLDNSERSRYQPGIALLTGWARQDYQDRWTTSVFQRPGE